MNFSPQSVDLGSVIVDGEAGVQAGGTTGAKAPPHRGGAAVLASSRGGHGGGAASDEDGDDDSERQVLLEDAPVVAAGRGRARASSRSKRDGAHSLALAGSPGPLDSTDGASGLDLAVGVELVPLSKGGKGGKGRDNAGSRPGGTLDTPRRADGDTGDAEATAGLGSPVDDTASLLPGDRAAAGAAPGGSESGARLPLRALLRNMDVMLPPILYCLLGFWTWCVRGAMHCVG
jgi:hypothetical protein